MSDQISSRPAGAITDATIISRSPSVLTAEVVSGGPEGTRSRITKLFVRQGQHWRLAALHSSGIGGS